MSIEKRIEKLIAELERTKLEHPGGRKAYWRQFFAEKEKETELAWSKLLNSLGLEVSVVAQEAKESNRSRAQVIEQHLGWEPGTLFRLLKERVESSRAHRARPMGGVQRASLLPQ